MRPRTLAPTLLALLALVVVPAQARAQVCTDSNGTFRFLNADFPDLSTNGPVFVGQLVVANADGPVTFSVDPSSPDPLPAGFTLDPDSGLVTGLAQQAGNKTVLFRADDTTQSITREVDFSISSSGGGGNGGSGLDDPNFPDGRVGVAYTHDPLVPGGDGPYTYGGSDLPPGLSLDGATGQLTGTPTAAGTWFVSLTVYDAAPNEENIGTSVVPIVIHPRDLVDPPDYDFEIATQFLNNGEVGTPYCDQYAVSGAAAGGAVTYGAVGLPAGLTLDPLTGAVTGTPTTAGTYLVTLTAKDGTATLTTNLSMIIAPSASATLHWNFLGLPPALVGTLYDRAPAIAVAAEGATGSLTYAATGLPSGITYDAGSGELSGTATKVGEYPVTLTATDGGNSDSISLDLLFVVLPATGGDVAQIILNFWVTKAELKVGLDGRESWRGAAIYNADRRAGTRFDPATDAFVATLESRVLDVAPGECIGTLPDQDCSFKTATGVIPGERARITPDKQTLTWSTSNDTMAETVPGLLWQSVELGDESYRVPLRFDVKGRFRPPLDFERTAFVVKNASVSLSLTTPDVDSAKLDLLLGDPTFSYEAGVSTLRVRILDGVTVLLDREFTALGGVATQGIDSRTGKPWLSFKTLTDPALTEKVAFSYSSKTGAMKVTLSKWNLSAITDVAAHLTVEVTIGDRVYTAPVTLFEKSIGKYSIPIP